MSALPLSRLDALFTIFIRVQQSYTDANKMKIGHPIGMQRQDPSISRAWPAVALAVVLTGPPRVACQFQPPCYWCTTPSPLHDGFTFVGAGFCADGYLRGRNDVRSLDDCKAQVWRGRSSFRSDFAAAISGHKNNKIITFSPLIIVVFIL